MRLFCLFTTSALLSASIACCVSSHDFRELERDKTDIGVSTEMKDKVKVKQIIMVILKTEHCLLRFLPGLTMFQEDCFKSGF